MAYENGEWIMHGTAKDDPNRIQSVEELIAYVDHVGFLPLFKNVIDGSWGILSRLRLLKRHTSDFGANCAITVEV